MTDVELTELAATRVMGWELRGSRWLDKDVNLMRFVGNFKPLTSLDDAKMLIDAIQTTEPGWRFSLLGGDKPFNYMWIAEFFGHIDPHQNTGQRHSHVYAKTAARAIVMAALEAAGVEIKDNV